MRYGWEFQRFLPKFSSLKKYLNEPFNYSVGVYVGVRRLTVVLTLNRWGGVGWGGRISLQAGASLCCAEMVSNRKLKLSDFYYILTGLNSEYKSVPWDIHCCHGNAVVEGCSVKFWLKSVENCIFLLKSFSNLSLGLLFVISISKLHPVPNFKQIELKTKKLVFSTFLAEQSLKYKMTSYKCHSNDVIKCFIISW